MGNCTGVFSTCCGDDPVKRVDKEQLKKAVLMNQNGKESLDGG